MEFRDGVYSWSLVHLQSVLHRERLYLIVLLSLAFGLQRRVGDWIHDNKGNKISLCRALTKWQACQ